MDFSFGKNTQFFARMYMYVYFDISIGVQGMSNLNKILFQSEGTSTNQIKKDKQACWYECECFSSSPK